MKRSRRSILATLVALTSAGTVTGAQDDYPEWDDQTVYVEGDRVSHGGYVWEAHWGTVGDEPYDTAAVWNRIGSVGNQDEYPSWTPTGIYRAGNRVVHAGYVWEARWWTEGDNPAEMSSDRPWKQIRAVDVSADADKETDDKTDDVDDENPAGPDGEWSLMLDEQWEKFDKERWAVGFIDREDWISDDDASVSDDHVVVANGRCTLQIESEGRGKDGCFQGVINSSVGGEDWHPSSGVPIDSDPGQYMEARIKMPGRTGILPAFWAHPADMTWPPEIDVVELFQWGDDKTAERRTLHADVHWTSSGVPGDMDNHEHNPYTIDTGIDLTETFNTFGCAWFEDRIEWYFNGEHVLTRDGPDVMLETLADDSSRPFGLIFSNHVNRLGEADLDKAWVEEMVIDWVRVWEFADAAPEQPASADSVVLDDFDAGEFDDGWQETGAWKTTDSLASVGSHSAFTDTPFSRMIWHGEPNFPRRSTLQFEFSFNELSSQQLNCYFGHPKAEATNEGYRLDIRRDNVALLDTGNEWAWLAGDESYENETVREWHTVKIEFAKDEIMITVDGDSSGSLHLRDARYVGDSIHFEIDSGGAYIDNVQVTDQ
ncbi:family 16 glycosylhydrolase [Halalkalicoccus salilacus]|uniref:family 16 glycosylhydrolase n=1 Tax=Halalkalicoccus salilacus TaxID=3117459 RepID=UPI00300F5C3E